MDDTVSIFMKELKLSQFEGPLELLLNLIEQQELSITEVAIADVTEQFFKHLDTLDESRSEELADFLVIATKLVYLKSKHLLPYLYPEENEGPSLADQLKLYKKYADASKIIEKLWQSGKLAYGRVEPPIHMEEFILPENATADHLRRSFALLLKKIQPPNPLPEVRIDRTVSVKQKIQSIFEAIQKFKKMSFKDILDNSESKTEVIVSFLALLELVKQEKVYIDQVNAFDNMSIKKV